MKPKKNARKSHKDNEAINPVGSGNIFEDLGFSKRESAELSLKSCLFRNLQEALKNAPGTQTEIAKRLRLPQPKVSDIINGKMAGYSIERMVHLLVKLDYEVAIFARPAEHGRVVELSGETLSRSKKLRG